MASGRRVLDVQRQGKRIVYADKEVNYCATCQTGGKLLADRALSRLLKGDWPRTLAAGQTIQPGTRAGNVF